MHFGATFPMLIYFKRVLLPQLSSNLNKSLQKACIHGKIQPFTASVYVVYLKVYATLKINYLSYIPSIHNDMLALLWQKGKQIVKAPGLLFQHVMLQAGILQK